MKLPGVRVIAMAGATALAVGVLAGLAAPASARTAPALSPGLAASGTPFGQAQFAAVGTGSELHLSALTAGNTTLAGLEQAFAAQSVNSTGLSNNKTPGKSALFDSETGALLQPSAVTTAAKSAYGRGSGIELGLGLDNTSTTDPNQFVFPSGSTGSKLVEASSPPSPSQDKNTLLSLPGALKPIVSANALEAQAATNFNNSFCPLGNPIAFGEGHLADAGVLPQDNVPTVDTSNGETSGLALSRTFSFLAPNKGDGTFGVVSETQQTILPLAIHLGPLTVEVTVQGDSPSDPITLIAKAPGEAGQGGGVTLASDATASIDVLNNGTSAIGGAIKVKIGNILPPTISLGGLGTIEVAKLTKTGNGTTAAAGTYDLLHIHLNNGLLDFSLGHMAVLAAAQTPISCNIPVKKSADPSTVTAGNPFTYTISVPITSSDLKDTTCDLVNINVTDTISVEKADDPANPPTWTINGASNGGVITGNNKVAWTNLGPYHPGDPPIMLTINVTTTGTGGGTLKDLVNVTASLGNCKGNTQGITGITTITTGLNGTPMSGGITFIGPTIMGKHALPRTGGGGPVLPWVAGGLLLLAEATRRLIRRARRAPSTT